MNKLSLSAAWSRRQLEILYTSAGALLGLWLVAWLALPWTSMQDAAYAYLRSAEDLAANRSPWAGGIDWNQGHWSFLYLLAVMVCRILLNSIYVMRLISTAGYLLLVARVYFALAERVRRAGLFTLLSSLVLLGVLVSPAAVYALNDGTESVWTLICAASMILAVRRVARHGTSSVWPLAMWSFVAAALHPEMILAALTSTLVLALWSHGAAATLPTARKRGTVKPWKTPILGALAGFVVLCVVRMLMQSGSPVHALPYPSWWLAALQSAARSWWQAGAFGWCLFLLWIGTGFVALRASARRHATVIANALPLAALGLLLVRGQAVHYAAELAWAPLYASLWNILELATVERDATDARRSEAPQVAIAVAILAALLVSVTWDGPLYLRSIVERGRILHQFASEPLALLGGLRGMASHNGYISFYTAAPICNPGETVDGHLYAPDYGEHIGSCVDSNPEFALLDRQQAEDLGMHMDLSAWWICQSFNLPRLNRHDQQFLMAAPGAVERVCNASRGMAVPLASILADYPDNTSPR